MAINTSDKKPAQAPLDIAKETFKQLVSRRMVPTPENYERVYNELAGAKPKDGLDAAIKKALLKLPHETSEQVKWVGAWNKLLSQENWDSLPELLGDGLDLSVNFSKQWPEAIRALLKAWDAKLLGMDNAKKKEALDRMLAKFATDPTLAQKIQTMSSSWMEYQNVGDKSSDVSLVDEPTTSAIPPENKAYSLVEDTATLVEKPAGISLLGENIQMSAAAFTENLSANAEGAILSNQVADPFQENFKMLQEVLRQALKHGLIPRLDGYPDLQETAFEVSELAEKAKKIIEWQEVAKQFRALLVKVELIGANEEGIKQDLLRLLKLLVDNVGELVSDDQWLRGQIATVQTIISSPLERVTINDAEKSLKEVIYKQGVLKHSLAEARNSFKSMITTFVDRLGYMSDSTGNYEKVMENFAAKLSETDDISTINQLLESLMTDTHLMQADIVRSRDDLLAQREMVDAAQEKIKKLEQELESLSEKVRIDQLTGVLNRRGMDEAMTREVARAGRSGAKLSIALLDIDNFKKLNDNYGHHVGDEALKHLALVIQESIRPTDIVSRFGGEEFVILLPNTDMDQAMASMTRLQRALTKRFFMGNNERLLITFSAGVALYKETDDQASVLHRADQAMYIAKKSGKNKTMTENDIKVNTE